MNIIILLNIIYEYYIIKINKRNLITQLKNQNTFVTQNEHKYPEDWMSKKIVLIVNKYFVIIKTI